LVNPELFTLETGRIRVATDGLAQGQTMLKRKEFIDYPQNGWEGVPMTQVCMQVDAEACKTVLERALMGNWLAT
jgi:purine nucleosidase